MLLIALAFVSPVSAEETVPTAEPYPRSAPDSSPAKPYPDKTYSWEGDGSECQSIHDEASRLIEESFRRQHSLLEEFLEKQRAEAEQARNENPNWTSEDWNAFAERQRKELVALEDDLRAEHEELAARLKAEVEAKCGSDQEQRPPPGPAGTTTAPCDGRDEQFWQALEELRARWEPKLGDFNQRFDEARKAFASESHSDEEWKLFSQQWFEEGKALFDGMSADARSLMEANGVLDCFEVMASHGGISAGPVPAYGATTSRSEAPYAKTGKHEPTPLDREAEAIWRECEARVKAIVDDWHGSHDNTTSPNPSNASSPTPYSHKDWREFPKELEHKLWEVKRECEERVHALYKKNYHDDAESHKDSFGSFTMLWDPETGRIKVHGKHLSMTGIPEAQLMTEITVQGALVIDSLAACGLLAEFRPEQTSQGTAIQVFDSTGKHVLSVHDNPRGVINLRATDEIVCLTLDLADDLKLEDLGEKITFSGTGVEGAVLLHGGDVEVGDGNVLKIAGAATFLVANEGVTDEPLGANYKKAILDKKLGAEVVISGEGDEVEGDSTPYGDLEVDLDDDAKKGEIKARVESASGTGKTVNFKVAKGTLPEGDVEVLVLAVNEDGTRSEICLREADDLDDVLDPLNDGDCSEYWVVLDKYGLQVLVSFAHFSEKEVTIRSLGASENGLIPGFETVAGLAAVGVVLIGVGLRRRKE